MDPEQIELFAVWTTGIANDTRKAALNMAEHLDAENLHHFWDPNNLVSSSYAKQFNWKGKQAWDIYLFFQKNASWSDPSSAPSPHLWFHQRAGMDTHRDKQVADWRMRKRLQNIIDTFVTENEDN